MKRTVLVVGPGWLGAPTATMLARQGARVFTLHRSGGEAPAGCVGVRGSIDTAADDSAVLAELPHAVDDVVVCVSPSRARGDDYTLYPAAARGVAAIAPRLSVRSIVWVSSTGVYDRQDGSVVDERTPIEPRDVRVEALIDAERIVADAASVADRRIVRIVRAAGLYGPGRDPAGRFATGATPAETWCNFAWRDDVRDAITHLLGTQPGAAVETFNCADGHPVQAGDITRALGGTVASATAPTVAPAMPAGGRVRSGRSNQRVSVAALLSTGWSPSMPTVFDGLRALGHPVA